MQESAQPLWPDYPCWPIPVKLTNPAGKIGDYFSKGDVVLFQGDSITDAGRDKENEGAQ